MIKYNNTNNASTTLTAWISPSSTTLIVENGDILPTAPFLLTLEHFDNEKVTVREIVKCIAKVGTILTVQRGSWTCVQDDTATPKAQNNTPHSFSVWDCASIYWTSEQVQDIQNEIEKKLNIDDFQAWTYVYGATSTWTDAYSITIPWTLTSYSVGQVFRFMADTENTWNATLNVNGIWEKEILKNHDQHLQSGDIEAGQIVEVAYDGTNFQMDSQIASVISLDDISSLSYNDTTCYAWEEIHENDLIVTNGNSFNPDWADEDLSVWGITVNKYAIGFIGNGKSADKIYIKGNFIEWFDPDSVTMNIESDDNWKPSWTVLNTVEAKTYFRWHWDESSFMNYDWDDFSAGKYPWNDNLTSLTNVFWLGFWQIYASWSTVTIGTRQWNITMNFGEWTYLWSNNAGTKFVFKKNYNTITIYNCPTPFSLEWATSNDFTFPEITLHSARPWEWIVNLVLMEGWKIIFIHSSNAAWAPSWQNFDDYLIYTETPYIFSEYTATNLWTIRRYQTLTYFYKNNKHYLYSDYNYNGSTYNNRIILEDWTIESTTNTNLWIYWYALYYWDDFLYVKKSDRTIKEFAYTTAYTPKKLKIPLSSAITTTKWTKYRLTIAPTITWSVVDCVKISDKEGEYYSECAVRDLNSWSNVSNKTPYIDSSCVLARYARKVNENDKLEKIPFWFANWDFTELESVQYTFQGLKTWFSDLITDSLYYSDWTWWITRTIGQYVVWKSTDSNSLLVQFTPFVQIIAWKQYTLKSWTWSFTVEQTWDYLIEMHWWWSNNRDSWVKITNSSDEIIYTASTNNDSRVYRFTPWTYTVTTTWDWQYAWSLTSNITYTKIPYNS